MTNSASTIIQTEVDALLRQLQELRQQIAIARETIAPLEANLAEVYDEFQAVVGGLRRQSMRLQAEIATLRAQIDRFSHDQDDTLEPDESNDKLLYVKEEETADSASVDPEAIEKDMLLEHLFRVLDPMVNHEDGELLANLQGLCSDPIASLADVLEELPWGLVWTTHSLQENIADQHRRLAIWEQALKRQMEKLNRATERLKKDQRYGLWQQREKGTDDWRTFLDQCIEQQQDQNYELQAELDSLREEWGRITSASNL
jgi:predicted  nucleic acid-binding Zn-ribbon protein